MNVHFMPKSSSKLSDHRLHLKIFGLSLFYLLALCSEYIFTEALGALVGVLCQLNCIHVDHKYDRALLRSWRLAVAAAALTTAFLN